MICIPVVIMLCYSRVKYVGGVFMTRVAYRANKEKYGIQKMICTQNDISVK